MSAFTDDNTQMAFSRHLIDLTFFPLSVFSGVSLAQYFRTFSGFGGFSVGNHDCGGGGTLLLVLSLRSDRSTSISQ